jgi:SAM-dependent methyltransferase
LKGVEVCGSDRDERALEWCRLNLPFARFEQNGLAPPLAYDDGAFELVYALSVFTHLAEELQRLWLIELDRVLRPGGLFILTTHGARYADRLDAGERSRFAGGEIVVRWEEVEGTNLCAAFHPPEAVARLAAERGFQQVEFVAEGARGNPHQDLHVFRKA